MLALNLDKAPRWINLVGGQVRVRIRPLTTAIMMAVISDLVDAGKVRSTDEDGGAISTEPVDQAADIKDASVPDDTEGWHVALVKAIAVRVITEWAGVGDMDGAEIAVTPEAVDALMDLHKIFAEFDTKVVAPYLMVQSEKKGSAPLPDGTSERAPITAMDAGPSAKSAPAA